MYALEVASVTLRPGKGTSTGVNCSCAFSSYSGDDNVELGYIPSKKTPCKFVEQFESPYALWARPGDQVKSLTEGPGIAAGTRKATCGSVASYM